MQFIKNGADVPEHLLQAHEDGRVVFFCGAGISYPAHLREFGKLTERLYSGLGVLPKPIALRRLFPALRIDYIRVVGTQWVDDPEQRFQSVDIRKPLMLALPVAEASIVDELPKGFRLPEGELQSRQEPALSCKVIREALANAVMHRSYQDHGPIQIIRYSNRIEILNPGYSLKDMASLGTPGSRLRNAAIAAVLHELNWAETKDSGIRTMRHRLASIFIPNRGSFRWKVVTKARKVVSSSIKVVSAPYRTCHLNSPHDYPLPASAWTV